MLRIQDIQRVARRIGIVTLPLACVTATAAEAAVVTRGPYLQQAAHDGIVIRWRTDVDTDSRVLCGSAPASLTVCGELLTPTTEHVVPLSSLNPDTQYFYAIGSTTEILAGGDSDHFFYTGPTPATPRPLRIWVIGDSGTANANQAAVRDAYIAFAAGAHTDLWLMLGDNAYASGTDAQYQAAVFDMYPDLLRRTALFPTIGNHDIIFSNSATETGPYFDIFTLPTNAESGGLASNTEAYYSFDYANVHFVVLNSFDLPRTPGGEMLAWLESDLAATTQAWIVAYWHHPPYSKGSHDSDIEVELVEMRQFALPILEDHGVDLVLNGHSHSYERSYFIDGHYGASDAFGVCDDAGTPEDTSDDFCAGAPETLCPNGVIDCDIFGFLVDAGDGSPSGDGAYGKPALGPDPHRGTVYTVAGSAGQAPGGGSLDHPAMFVSLNLMGSLVLDVDGDTLSVTFIDNVMGAPLDSFTIVKGLDCPSGPYLDDDGDGVCNDLDNCPNDANPNQEDGDVDEIGDACDVCPNDASNDADDDGVCGDVDNCPDVSNADQLDADGDGSGDACDICPADPDDDIEGDGFCADQDNCPTISNPAQADGDDDGVGDACDSCPGDPLNDPDLDGVCGAVDTCPQVFDPCQIDGDGDGVGDVCDASAPEVCDFFVQADAWIAEKNPFTNYGADTKLRTEQAVGEQERAVFRFPDESSPAPLLSATAWFFVKSADESGLPVNVHRITEGWTEQGITWNSTAAAFEATPAGYFSPLLTDAWVSVDLTVLAQAWNDGSHPNHGVMFQTTSTGSTSKYAGKELDPELRACLDVVFQCLTPDHDSDGDGIADADDGCPNDAGKSQPGDCGCGVADSDSDGDGTADCVDGCAADPDKTAPGVCGCGVPDVDSDLDGSQDCEDICPFDADNDLDTDGVCGDVDNCPAASNSNQANTDADGTGDVCDTCPLDPEDDFDGDGVCADADNCPTAPNAGQADADGDGIGDLCDDCPLDQDNDLDGDGDCGNVDNCPAVANPGQEDTDGNGIGDACQAPDDADGDSVPDTLDNCPAVPNPVQRDADGDSSGDACDSDDDGDGVEDTFDCAPLDPGLTVVPGEIGATLRLAKTAGGTSLTWLRGIQGHVSHVYRGLLAEGQLWHGDLDCIDFANPDTQTTHADDPGSPGSLFYFVVSAANACGEGPLCEGSPGSPPRSPSSACPAGASDADGDAVLDVQDNCPLTSNPDLSDVDLDFVGDVCDNCPTVANPDQADGDVDGRGDVCESLVDQDGDGIEDAVDNCPAVFNTTQEDGDSDGLGDACDPCPDDPTNPDDDSDLDGTPDCADLCPFDPEKTKPGACGCGAPDTDTDADGTADCLDLCPLDPEKVDPGGCGCGVSDADSDGDLVPDCEDPCPNTPGIDSDGDGVCDDVDNCVSDFNSCQIDTDGDGIGNVCDDFGPESCNVFVDADSWLKQSSPDKINGTEDELISQDSTIDTRRPVFHFDLSSAPQNATLVSAKAWFFVTESDPSGEPVEIHRITDDWTENEVTWANTGDDFDGPVSGSLTPTIANVGYPVDLTALVQGWANGTWPNYGLMFLSTSVDIKSKYASKEWAIVDQRPCMEFIPECGP